MTSRTLLVGPAGTGKTRALLTRVADFLTRGRGAEAVLLVPSFSQATHLKRLLPGRTGELPGFFDESVVTFTTLAERILSGPAIRGLLSGLPRDLLLRQAIASGESEALRELGRHPGFRRSVLAFIKELKQNGLSAEEVGARLDEIARERGGTAAERLAAFRSVYLAYERRREERGLSDHEDYLRDARDALRDKSTHPPLAWFGVDGFQNFTNLERELLLELSATAKETIVTLPGVEGPPLFTPPSFRVARETEQFLLDRGFRLRRLTGNRRARAEPLARLTEALTDSGAEPIPAGEVIRVLVGADAEDEADRVARTIHGLVAPDAEGFRYQDILVIVRDVSRRRAAFTRAFDRYGLPLRVYGRESLARHPFVRAVRTLLAVALADLSCARVLSFLRADQVEGVPPAEIDRLEEALGAGCPPRSRDEWVQRVAAFSPRGAQLLTEVLDAGREEAGSARPEWIRRVLARFLVPLWHRDRTDPERIRREAAAVREVERALAEVEAAERTGDVAPEQVLPFFLDALSELSTGPSDRRLETVNLIDAREARQWEAPVVFVCGLTEGEFPKATREDSFLPDADRRWANEERKLRLRERELDREEETYLFYVALSRARQRLYLSWPGTDAKGEDLPPSSSLAALLTRIPDLDRIVSRRHRSDLLPREEEIVLPADLHRQALLRISLPRRPGTHEDDPVREAAALHNLLVGADDGPPDPAYLRAVALGARFFRPPAGVLTVVATAAERRVHSASSLEDFVRCPYRHFAARILRLTEPERTMEDGLSPRLLGEIGHEVLERLFRRSTEGGALPAPDEVAPVFEKVFAAKAAGVPAGLRQERGRVRLLRSLERTVAKEVERLEGSDFRPRSLEEAFGPASRRLEVRGAEGDGIDLSGRVDRIDVGPDGRAVVIDYKSRLSQSIGKIVREVEEGEHLQLPVYLLAVRDAFGLKPAGAWLLGIEEGESRGFACSGAPAPDRAEILTPEGLEDLLTATRERITGLASRISAGGIEIRPRTPDQCSRCDFGDLCRYESWLRTEGEEE